MLLNRYINFINSCLPTRAQNEGGWIGAAITAGAALVGALSSSDKADSGGGSAKDDVILPKTVSGQNLSEFDILYSKEAEAAMTELTTGIGEWAENDRTFFEDTFQPFQEKLMSTNQALLPAIERVAGATMEQNAKDLMSNASLKESFRNVIGSTAGDVGNIASRFATELDNLPSSEERVGQALANTELQFGQVAKDLQKDMASRGQKVSEASKRQLLIDKATAKAGVAGAAAEAARTERRTALGEGAGVLAGVQASQTNQLLATQANQQSGLATPQVGGVTQADSGAELTGIQAGLSQAAGTKNIGSKKVDKDIQHTQAGTVGAPELNDDGSFTDEYKAEQATLLADKRKHELARARASRSITNNFGGVLKQKADTGMDGPGGSGVGAPDGGMTGGGGSGAGDSAGSGGQGGADADGGTGGPSR